MGVFDRFKKKSEQKETQKMEPVYEQESGQSNAPETAGTDATVQGAEKQKKADMKKEKVGAWGQITHL